MTNQNHPNKLKEKEVEKAKEKIMKLLGLPLSTMLLQGHDRALFEKTTPVGSTLIPRDVVTHIIVYGITTEIHMDLHRRHTNNVQHSIRANNTVITDLDLHTAASRGNIIDVQKVIQRKGELLLREDLERNLPLHLAVVNGHKEVARYLVRKYPQAAYALNGLNISPIYLAVVQCPKDLDLVECMLSELGREDDVVGKLTRGKSIVRAAIKDQNQEMLQTILKYHRDLIKSTDEEGITPLSYAAFNGYVDTISYFFKKYQNSAYYPNEDKSFPIHKACLGGQVDVLKMFHSKDPQSFFSSDRHGRNVLHLAAKERGNKLKRVVSYLLRLPEGEELMKKKDENGFTPLDLAKNSRNREVEQVIRAI